MLTSMSMYMAMDAEDDKVAIVRSVVGCCCPSGWEGGENDSRKRIKRQSEKRQDKRQKFNQRGFDTRGGGGGLVRGERAEPVCRLICPGKEQQARLTQCEIVVTSDCLPHQSKPTLPPSTDCLFGPHFVLHPGHRLELHPWTWAAVTKSFTVWSNHYSITITNTRASIQHDDGSRVKKKVCSVALLVCLRAMAITKIFAHSARPSKTKESAIQKKTTHGLALLFRRWPGR